jgi:hypothetical protein
LYEDLRYCRGKFFGYFRMSVESVYKLLEFLTEILDTPVCANTREIGSNTEVRKYLFLHITAVQVSLSVRYTNTIKVTKFV